MDCYDDSKSLCILCRKIIDLLPNIEVDELRHDPNGWTIARLAPDELPLPTSPCPLCRMLCKTKLDISEAILSEMRSLRFTRAADNESEDDSNDDSGHSSDSTGGYSPKKVFEVMVRPSQLRIPLREHSALEVESFEVRALSYLRYSHSLSFNSGKLGDIGDTMILALVPAGRDLIGASQALIRSHFLPKGHLMCQKSADNTSRCFRALAPTPYADLEMARQWLQHCISTHAELGTLKTSSVRPPGLKLIDCRDFCIVDAPPRVPYVTLSYVWGQEAQVCRAGEPHRLGTMDSLPRAISDAVEVVRRLGFRYLWVDRYCIDESDKHEQIRRMDSIYEQSEFTIVAAAGTDASAGLPGISRPREYREPGAELGGFVMVSVPPHPHHTIRRSKWNTRGWTFQEAVLSRRLLVFTAEQMYFECWAMNCCDAVMYPLDALFRKGRGGRRRFPGFMRAGLFNGHDEGIDNPVYSIPFGFGGGGDDVEGVGDWSDRFKRYLIYATNYTARDLKFDSDSLDAFAGVMRRMESVAWPIYRVQGVPYLLQPPPLNLDSFVAGLCWRHIEGAWNLDGAAVRRREGFPSWTWAGWAGTVSWTNLFSFNRMDIRSLTEDCRCELRGGEALGLEDYAKHTDIRNRSNADPVDVVALCFTAWVCPAEAIMLAESAGGAMWSFWGFEADLHISAFDGSTHEFLQALQLGRIQCVLVGKGMYNSYFLVVENQGDSARRIGTVEVIWNQYRVADGTDVNILFTDRIDLRTNRKRFRLI